MNLYRISQSEMNGYDTYDSAVVAAENEQEAVRIHPVGDVTWNDSRERWEYTTPLGQTCEWSSYSWATHVDRVSVEYIGEAAPNVQRGIVVASFNAG